MAKILLDTLIPIFAGLLLGYIAGLRGTMDNRNVRNLIVPVMSFAPEIASSGSIGTYLVGWATLAFWMLFAAKFF